MATKRRRAPAAKILAAIATLLRNLARSQLALAAENALLREQLRLVGRPVPRVRADAQDRAILATLARLVPRWRELVSILAPETVLRWQREGWRAFWRRKSGAPAHRRRLRGETRDLIRGLALENPRWGAKRIVGELWSKLRIRVHKRTVQRILREPELRDRRRRARRQGQSWATFVRNHLPSVWACDFFTVPTAFFGQVFVFFILELGTRRILQWNVTYHPTREWTAKQLRQAKGFDEAPRFLIRDRDDKYGPDFDSVAKEYGARILLTPPGAPQANAYAERLVGTIRRECLDHFLILGERHLRLVLSDFCRHYHESRPHQGLGQRIPIEVGCEAERPPARRLVRRAILGGLINEYIAAA